MQAFVQVTPLFTPGKRLEVAKLSQRKHRTVICSKTQRPKKLPSKKSEGFAGMAAGPATPPRSRNSLPGQKPKKQKKGAETRTDELIDENEPEDAPLSDKRITRALGKTRIPSRTKIDTGKTIKDFIEEGVVDDVDDIGPQQLSEDDINFGISDLQDPFVKDGILKEKKRATEEEDEMRKLVGKLVNVTGDGGVKKCVLTAGQGETVPIGATVRVQYKGRLEDGSVFDDSSSRGDFEFVLGKGTVIKGWEAGVASMRKGEEAQFTIEPGYAYGRRGMPPVIPSNAILTFQIELMSYSGCEEKEVKTVPEFNPDIARTPDAIAKEYDQLLDTQEERRKGMTFLERFYIINPFASQTGEKPPWYINPNITFVIIPILVVIGFYFVVISGAIHIGYVDYDVDVNIFK